MRKTRNYNNPVSVKPAHSNVPLKQYIWKGRHPIHNQHPHFYQGAQPVAASFITSTISHPHENQTATQQLTDLCIHEKSARNQYWHIYPKLYDFEELNLNLPVGTSYREL